MTLKFKTSNATDFKSEIIKLIESGDLLTWKILTHNNEKYLKHVKQWGDKGVISLTTDSKNEYLISNIVLYKDSKENIEDFEGYYLGRFCELIFVNFPKKFTSIENK